MPHRPEPFYKARRRTWYVEIGRVQHVLGKHPEGLPQPVKGRNGWNPPPSIRHAFHRRMAEVAEQPAVSAQAGEHPFVASVIDEYVSWLQARVDEGSKAQRTLAQMGPRPDAGSTASDRPGRTCRAARHRHFRRDERSQKGRQDARRAKAVVRPARQDGELHRHGAPGLHRRRLPLLARRRVVPSSNAMPVRGKATRKRHAAGCES